MTVFREESGAVGLSGRDLPAAQALAGHANVVARAGLYEASGAFPGQTASGLQALAYLHLLNGVTAGDAIAFARTAAAEPPDGGGPDDGGPGDGGRDDSGRDARGRDGDAGDDDVSCGAAGSPGGASVAPGASGGSGSHGDDQGPDDDDDGPGDSGDPGGGLGSDGGGDGSGGAGARLVLPEVTVPLVTCRDARPGRGEPAARPPRPGDGP